MKKIFLFAAACCLQQILYAQHKPARPVTPDINKLMKMSPAEQEAYKNEMLKQLSTQAKDLADKGGIAIDESLLPDFQLTRPVKDTKRLATIPAAPPTQQQLMQGVQQSLKQVQTLLSPEEKTETSKMIAVQDASELERSGVALFYNNQPAAALTLSMNAVKKSPDSAILWNNLAAMYNMVGAQERAVPILMTQLVKFPTNPMLLNNMGQAYLGLGDVDVAQNYFIQCLKTDEFNIEANRSMGIISVLKNQMDKAQQYFQKELQMAQRRSTIAQMHRMGAPVDLYALRCKRPNVPNRDYFEEIELGKYKLPDLPMSAAETDSWLTDVSKFRAEIAGEYFFWSQAGQSIKKEEIEKEGRSLPGIYSDLERELSEDLGNTFIPLLEYIQDADIKKFDELLKNYYQQLDAKPCPSPPLDPNGGDALIKAYEKKCCDLHTPIVDQYMKDHNSYLERLVRPVIPRWKEYINGMIAIMRLNPTVGNKLIVYKTVANYFTFLGNVLLLVAAEPLPDGCKSPYTSQQADSIIHVHHEIDFSCPSYLNISIDLQVASLKADCSKYAIEGGKFLQGSYEKNFKTGTSTLAAGVGVSQSFWGVGKASLSQMVYVSFDNNNNFSDLGLKGDATISAGTATESLVTNEIGKISTTIAGVKGGYNLGLNSGFSTSVKGSGILSGFQL